MPTSNREPPLGEGTILDGRYRLGAVLGTGGMAVVYAARHLGLDQDVAIKLLLPEACNDAETVARFSREGRAASKIRSEHVVRVLDVGVSAERPYLVLEYLAGEDLEQALRKRERFPVAQAVDLVAQACEALAEAHALGIIHRDLKPSNLFLTHRADGSCALKVLDFGISKVRGALGDRFDARSTQATTVMGTPQYMAPEQMESATAADERSDIWSLGIIVCELVTGAVPFEATSSTELYARVLRSRPSFGRGLPAALEQVVSRCLEKDPRRRFPNVAALARALSPLGTPAARASAERAARVVEVMPARSHAPSSMPTMRPLARQLLERPPRRRRRRGFGYAVATLLVIGSLGLVARTADPYLASSPTRGVQPLDGGETMDAASASLQPPSSPVAALDPPRRDADASAPGPVVRRRHRPRARPSPPAALPSPLSAPPADGSDVAPEPGPYDFQPPEDASPPTPAAAQGADAGELPDERR